MKKLNKNISSTLINSVQAFVVCTCSACGGCNCSNFSQSGVTDSTSSFASGNDASNNSYSCW